MAPRTNKKGGGSGISRKRGGYAESANATTCAPHISRVDTARKTGSASSFGITTGETRAPALRQSLALARTMARGLPNACNSRTNARRPSPGVSSSASAACAAPSRAEKFCVFMARQRYLAPQQSAVSGAHPGCRLCATAVVVSWSQAPMRKTPSNMTEQSSVVASNTG